MKIITYLSIRIASNNRLDAIYNPHDKPEDDIPGERWWDREWEFQTLQEAAEFLCRIRLDDLVTFLLETGPAVATDIQARERFEFGRHRGGFHK